MASGMSNEDIIVISSDEEDDYCVGPPPKRMRLASKRPASVEKKKKLDARKRLVGIEENINRKENMGWYKYNSRIQTFNPPAYTISSLLKRLTEEPWNPNAIPNNNDRLYPVEEEPNENDDVETICID